MLHNKDFYGTMIVDPDAPLAEKVKEYGKFMARSFTPFGIRNALVAREPRPVAGDAGAQVSSVSPSTARSRPDASAEQDGGIPIAPRAGSRTPEESDKGELHRDV
jgi:hypothetical protein